MKCKQYAAWLQYDRIEEEPIRALQAEFFSSIAASYESEVVAAAVKELCVYAKAALGTAPNRTAFAKQDRPCIFLGLKNDTDWNAYGIAAEKLLQLAGEGFLLETIGRQLYIIGGSDRGVLYGVFHLLRLLQTGSDIAALQVLEQPANSLRLMNQWDNADGTIERGYAGRSIFYENNEIKADLARVRDYARLLASVGINGISVNNVNVHQVETSFITSEGLPAVARIADVFREYGIRLLLSVNFASPIEVGGLSTADPLDVQVKEWWRKTAAEIYRHIPDFLGFLVKADSEHRPGPFTYGRDHADGANMLGEALEPFGGLVIWRCFVYNCMQDWRDRSTDRAKAAYDHFQPLDGRFHANVILQIKNGPMDFQVREPVSPLFGAMPLTNQSMEFQITQEYTGQQKHLCYLVPQWKQVLEFDTHVNGPGSTVKRIVDGSLFGRPYSGIAAVSNIGDDENWTGHTLAQANLYGYGRLIWKPELSAEDIAGEWIRLTFGHDPAVVSTVSELLMNSWPIYESYTAPLGVGWMVAPNHHYGPDVDGYEYSRWGTYHFADRDGIGVDRTVETGTGYTAQYAEPNAAMYNDIRRCPDELLLFFHHVPYSHRLHSGETVIEHIYNTRFQGAERAEKMKEQWQSLEGKIDSARYEQVLGRLTEQAVHAKHWRDVINTYFYRKSGVSDALGRLIYT
ncbi:alpha-glucuronidase family glycosyl hydrolase [Paenibacillus turpanensis]|uniref:alpha-glucuronidase family glycosyl hydrolase n=1 Tax=Paenibacillus turpanensis TaxID=2689078 RepID=UPI001FB6EF1A|nr:alpha-glucuronidase family glycosyl hydrolase [Paenibacillus turpanensis]